MIARKILHFRLLRERAFLSDQWKWLQSCTVGLTLYGLAEATSMQVWQRAPGCSVAQAEPCLLEDLADLAIIQRRPHLCAVESCIPPRFTEVGMVFMSSKHPHEDACPHVAALTDGRETASMS